MPLSLYEITIPPFIKDLGVLSKILQKGQSHFQATSQQESAIPHLRLIADQGDLIFQIQQCVSTARALLTNVAGLEEGELPAAVPKEDLGDIKSLVDLLQSHISLLTSISPSAFEQKEDKEVTIKSPKYEFKWTGRDYVLNYTIPNFFFHFVTAYSLLRKEGVSIGKMDYLGMA